MTSPYTRGDGAGAAEDQPFEAVVRVMQQAIEERRDGGMPTENSVLAASIDVAAEWRHAATT